MHLLLQSMYIILKVCHDADSHSMLKSHIGSRRAVLVFHEEGFDLTVCYLRAASAHGKGDGPGPRWA